MSKLTILIGTYNRLSRIKKTLTGLLANKKEDHEIVVLDAGSTDGTSEYLKKLRKKVKLVDDIKKEGQIKSFNRYLPFISGEYVCWLSDDNLVIDGMLDLAVSILDKNKDFGMVGLKVMDVLGKFSSEPYIGGIWPSGILNVNQGMIRTGLLRKINYFDEAFPDYGMDADLTTKVLLAGYAVVYTRQVAILHYRDYQQNPGAFERKERNIKMTNALKIYCKKYNYLCKRYKSKNKFFLKLIYAFWINVVSFIYLFIDNEDYRLSEKPKFNSRDWKIILTAEFISRFDLWYNRKKSYYLIQKIPKSVRL